MKSPFLTTQLDSHREYFKAWKELVNSLEPEELKPGDTSCSVKTLQRVLQGLSLFEDQADGYFGATTRAAVITFQQEFGLLATGIFDVDTWYALNFWIEIKSVFNSEYLEPTETPESITEPNYALV